MKPSREIDIVLWGATGFTGRLVAEYLLRHAADSRVALAGRSRARLESVKGHLVEIDPRARQWPLIVADANDRSSLDAMTSRTAVVCSTVGPYSKYGEALVASCVANETHYCDLTGEVPFIRRSIDTHHESAARSGTKIVHCCGFDSIPSDLGVLMLQGEAVARFGRPLREVKFFAGESKGGFSGGTVASLLGVLEEAKRDRKARKAVVDPYGLNPTGDRRGPDGPDQRGVRFDPDLEMWTAPFLMAPINTRVVRRSNALSGWSYGDDFRYSEAMSTGRGLSGLALASAVTAAFGVMLPAVAFGPTRALLERTVLPAPGEGPSESLMNEGFFVVRLIGKGHLAGGDPVELRGKVVGPADPGYRGTAIMLGQSALCLAHDRSGVPRRGGVLTPSTAMGMALVQRLRDAGMTWDVQAPSLPRHEPSPASTAVLH